MVVVEVETGLSHCDHPGVMKQLAKPCFGLGVPLPGIVRMNPRAGRQTGLGSRHGERCLSTRARLADYYYPANPCRPSPIEHLGPVRSERRVGEMAVGIDQQDPLPRFLTLLSAASGSAPVAWPSGGPDVPARQDPASASRLP